MAFGMSRKNPKIVYKFFAGNRAKIFTGSRRDFGEKNKIAPLS
jgi:hypothetical protein